VVVEENRLGFGFQGGVSARAGFTWLTAWEGREGRENVLYRALLPFPQARYYQIYYINFSGFLKCFSSPYVLYHLRINLSQGPFGSVGKIYEKIKNWNVQCEFDKIMQISSE
jgi:hypothetical protein